MAQVQIKYGSKTIQYFSQQCRALNRSHFYPYMMHIPKSKLRTIFRLEILTWAVPLLEVFLSWLVRGDLFNSRPISQNIYFYSPFGTFGNLISRNGAANWKLVKDFEFEQNLVFETVSILNDLFLLLPSNVLVSFVLLDEWFNFIILIWFSNWCQ